MIELKPLSYPYDSFEDVIDAKTMQIHYEKHLGGYINNYNNAIKETQFNDGDLIEVLKNLDSIDETYRTTIRNNGGGTINHYFYFEQLNPNNNHLERNEFLEKINEDFGSFDSFIETYKKECLSLFGSGWIWLVLDGDKLKLKQYRNQDNPYMDQLIPIMGIDVWEHAYYLKYQNVRADYVNNIFTIINWNVVNQRYLEALQ